MAHARADELRRLLDEAATKVEIGGRYAHYKHPELPYRIITIALTEADESPAVVYEAEYGERLTFIRPLESFLEEVEHEGDKMLRFIKLPA